MSKNISQIIEESRKDLAEEFMVTFLGEKFTGKTVITALIKHTLANYYSIHTKGEYQAWVSVGSTRMNQLLDDLTHGKFPPKTLPGDASPITLEIFSQTGVGGSIKIVLRDMAGESRDDYLVTEYNDPKNRLYDILTKFPINGKPYGELAHIPYAKLYIILIDCSKADEWEHQQSYITDTIRHLLQMKKEIGDVINNKIHNPIAIIFTKYDTLKEKDQKAPSELIKKLPEVVQALTIAHNGPIKYLKMQVESEKLTQKEIDALILEKTKLTDMELNKARNSLKDAEIVRNEASKSFEEIRVELEKARKAVADANLTNQPPVIESAKNEFSNIEKKFNQAQISLKNATNSVDIIKNKIRQIEEDSIKNPESPEKFGISKYRPTCPLKYSNDQCIELISWIIEMQKR